MKEKLLLGKNLISKSEVGSAGAGVCASPTQMTDSISYNFLFQFLVGDEIGGRAKTF